MTSPARQSKMSLIRQTPGVCGGAACIRSLRMPVWLLVEMRDDGLTDEQIVQRYEGMLTYDDLQAAWMYAAQHSSEIRSLIEANQAFD